MQRTAAVCLALAVNALLFWLMFEMVDRESIGLPDRDREPLMLSFVRVEKAPEPPPIDPLDTVNEPPPEEAPPTPSTPNPSFDKPEAETPRWQAPALELPLSLGKGPYLGGFRFEKPSAPAAEPIPLVRISPSYPQRALLRRIEGSVRVAFTITEEGLVTDAKIIEANPAGYFEQAALRAIRRWKFQPEIVDGVAISRPATQIIRFTMQK